MEVSEEVVDDVTIVAIAGRLDADAARQLGEHLTALIRTGCSRLLIEASKLDYIGSLGLRALLIAAHLAAEATGRLALCGLTALVRRVIELGGLDDVLAGYATREQALAHLRNAA
jgi:anti-sigma B factor antagonist